MQDAGPTISIARLNDLMTSLSEARSALDHWQNQRTEAMIRLDSFSYDIQKIEEEKARLLSVTEEIRKDAEARIAIHQKQVAELTDQLQEQKLEIETLKNAGHEKDQALERAAKDLENRDRMKDQLVEFHEKKITELEEAFRKRLDSAVNAEKQIQDSLSASLAQMTQRNIDSENKIERLERDLNHIRSHMLGLLQPKSAPVATAPAIESESLIRAMPNPELATVDDYLKRLGY